MLITQAADFMGPALCAGFAEHGAVGTEVASCKAQVNLIAQNFVDNPTYFPAEVQALPAFPERLRRELPAQRLDRPEEDAAFAVFLASDECGFLVGQSVPFAGGWAT